MLRPVCVIDGTRNGILLQLLQWSRKVPPYWWICQTVRWGVHLFKRHF